MIHQYQRGNMFGGKGGLFFLKWLFSDKEASSVLEERRTTENLESIKREKRTELQILRQEYESKERSLLVHQTQKYGLLAEQEALLSFFNNMSDTRQERLRDLRKGDIYSGFETEDLRKQQGRLTLELDHLRAAHKRIYTYLEAQNALPSEDLKTNLYVWPVDPPIIITAEFHDSVYEEKLGRVHDGVDFGVPQGSSVYAIAPGVVEKVYLGGFGYSFIMIHQNDGRYSTYGHLSQMLVNVGDEVTAGELIALSGGEVGSLGAGPWTTGPHLHLSLFDYEGFIDALKFLPKLP